MSKRLVYVADTAAPKIYCLWVDKTQWQTAKIGDRILGTTLGINSQLYGATVGRYNFTDHRRIARNAARRAAFATAKEARGYKKGGGRS